MSGGPLQASAIAKTLLCPPTNADLLVNEYLAAIEGRGFPIRTTEAIRRDAVMFVQKLLLQDICPPWLQNSFPQSLPGGNVLSRLTRPSFLTWKCDDALCTLFGDAVVEPIKEAVERYLNLNVAGLVARPLYACTNRLHDGDLCMRVASMSERFSQEHARKPYRCKKCTETTAHASLGDASQEPGTASSNLRVLYVWPLCLADNGGILPVNTHKITLLLHAPPHTWGWGHGGESHNDAAAVGADPAQDRSAAMRGAVHSKRYIHTEPENNAIWMASYPFAGTRKAEQQATKGTAAPGTASAA